jgi:hypothetical protein
MCSIAYGFSRSSPKTPIEPPRQESSAITFYIMSAAKLVSLVKPEHLAMEDCAVDHPDPR